MRRRSGFTIVEIAIVMVLLAVLVTMAIPNINDLRQRTVMASARQQLSATVAAARAAAIQKGRPARLRLADGVVTVWVGVSADSVQVVAPTDYAETFQVRLEPASAADTVITYDPRGFASPRLAQTARFRIVGSAHSDSVCVTPLGQLLPEGCTP